ncbi:MAG: hypothetical protein MUE73_11870 [Planctomycetes bacterium]|nr:hypothetical protein [Planctomycetota bacterium]
MAAVTTRAKTRFFFPGERGRARPATSGFSTSRGGDFGAAGAGAGPVVAVGTGAAAGGDGGTGAGPAGYATESSITVMRTPPNVIWSPERTRAWLTPRPFRRVPARVP